MSVFHIKYRPQKIAELDSQTARETLANFFRGTREIPRAFLFSGPKGSGKTSAARILAKVVNCLSPVLGDACGECSNCLEIGKQTVVDVIEIDAASNRGIDDVRSLKDRAYLAPTSLKYKVFIIDEVHMMTKEAFNALLKLIEEPPLHTFFVLCTTDWEKIPETVVSRLVRVEFRRGTVAEMVSSAKKVVESEGLKVDNEVLELLAGVADGSFRNLHRLLNELVLEKGKTLKKDDVNTFLELRVGDYLPEMMASDMVKGDLKIVLNRLEKMAEKQVDFVGFTGRLIEYFQALFLKVVDGENVDWTIERLGLWLRLLMEASDRAKGVAIGQLPLELAVVEFMKKVESQKLKVESKKEEEIIKEEKQETIETVDSVEVGMEPKEIVEKWGEVLAAIKPYNHSIEAFLRATRPKSILGKKLVVEVFYPFHKEKLEEQRNRKVVEEVLRKITGSDLEFSCVLAKSKIEPLVVSNKTAITEVAPGDDYEVAKQIFG
ncbi:MAG: DNA polymerase III subunit gamma/tau [Candidatus Shapirobacteria bacterium]